MPKTASVLLREALAKLDIELLDLYSFRDKDVIRVRDKASGRVAVLNLKTRVSSVTSRDDAVKVAGEVKSLLSSLSA
ncbi:MAG: hypothetical protein OWQ48_02265 [Desulfurococcus sp.]|nr:hypothetical protein [Desulfurococcus sp.]